MSNSENTSDIFSIAQNFVGDLVTPAVRLGVTGLSRSGKTVFITALVRNLMSGGRLPFFEPEAQGRIVRAYLQPQPDDDVPRFDYEKHLSDLLGPDQPHWPESTRQISEMRVTIEYRSDNTFKRTIGMSKLHLDIVDYPGEWLIDLALLEQDYRTFSREALATARSTQNKHLAERWLEFLSGTDPAQPEDEQITITGARLFTDYLSSVRASGAMATLPPGRFLLPGDLAGSPLLTFFPMPLQSDERPPKGSLAAMMMRRYDSYKSSLVKPFFDEHFSRLNRQIVLVDLLEALNSGPGAVTDLKRAMNGILRPFRPGNNNLLSFLLGWHIDRILFAATKTDHLPASSHDRLSAIMKHVVDDSIGRAQDMGADVSAMAIAAVRATRESEVKSGRELLPCLTGRPIAGEKIDGETFDGQTEMAIFPGDLPADPVDALRQASSSPAGSLSLVRFAPPQLIKAGSETDAKAAYDDPLHPVTLPHIRLDRALQFLIGDYLT